MSGYSDLTAPLNSFLLFSSHYQEQGASFVTDILAHLCSIFHVFLFARESCYFTFSSFLSRFSFSLLVPFLHHVNSDHKDQKLERNGELLGKFYFISQKIIMSQTKSLTMKTGKNLKNMLKVESTELGNQ